ncbi:DHA2 family efflux MFS transporter permease subunit [Lactobacillaceae bacterium Melli_B4]
MKNRFWITLIIAIGAFTTMLNQTILSVAQPDLMKVFSVNAATVQWLSTGYSLINGILIPITAWLADRFNTKWLYTISQTIFLLGTFGAFTAHSFNLLLAARLIQAVGAGVLGGLAMTILFSIYDKQERGIPTAMMGMIFGLAPAIGPTLGGWIVDTYSWRYIFGMLVPIAAVVIVLSVIMIGDVIPHKRVHFDWLSGILSVAGFGPLLLGFSNAGNDGWGSVNTYLPIIIGAVLTIAFIIRQLFIPNPVLQVRVFSSKTFGLTSLLSAIAQISMVAIEFVLPLYLQNLRGLSAIKSGLTLLPGAIVLFMCGPIVGKLVTKYGRPMLLIGSIITTVSTFLLVFITLKTPIWQIVSIYAIRNLGLALVLMPSGTVGMNALSKDLVSHGSASNNMVRQIGAAMGTATLISVMQNVTANHTPGKAMLATNPHLYVTKIYDAFLTGTHATMMVAVGIGMLGIAAASVLCLNQKMN